VAHRPRKAQGSAKAKSHQKSGQEVHATKEFENGQIRAEGKMIKDNQVDWTAKIGKCFICGSHKIYIDSRGHSDPTHEFKASIRCAECGAERIDSEAQRILYE
jgi:hypothetical protein